jgi:signal transduction histidine kinase/CheY-like chemotaxis protein
MLDSKFPMFLAWGAELTFLYNDAYAEILGDKHPRALGARFEDVWTEVWPDISPLVDRAMNGEATWIENLPLKVDRRGYTEEAWFTFSYSPVRDDTGCVAGMFCAVTETTGRVLAEAALRDLNRTLETRVEERSHLLQQAAAQFHQAQRFEAIGQLTGGIAHDFNNLLTVIRGSVDLLRRENLPEDRRQRYLDSIGSTAERAAKLTGQMLAFARRQALKPEAFDAKTGLEDIVDMISALTGPRIVFDLRTADEHCCILADRGQFETAIMNMILNARDAMNGEGQLSISVEPASAIPPPQHVDGDFVAVAITDTGAGIADELFDRIFEPFFTTKTVGAGTGLGLSQAIGFARKSGGDIRVGSVEGRGTTFTLYLPRTHMEADRALQAETIAEPIAGGGRRVLVVEDNEEVGAFAVQALQELGFETMLATNAGQALLALSDASGTFDVVFSDVVMPGMSGLDLAHEVTRLYPDLKIVLASGYSDALAQSGTQGFRLLSKRYSIQELSLKFTRVLGAAPVGS